MRDKKLVFIFSLIMLTCINISGAFAVTAEDYTSPQYMLNTGYSPEVIRMLKFEKQKFSADTPLKHADLKDNLIKDFFIYNEPIRPWDDFGNTVVDH